MEHSHEHNREEACGCDHHGHGDSCGCDHHEHGDSCGCSHHEHASGCGCGCGHDHSHEPSRRDLRDILLGGGLFVVGLLLDAFSLPGWVLYLGAYALLGWEILLHAGKNLMKGALLDENFLMGLATLGAFAIGEFPEAVGIMLFYRLGEYFEALAVFRSRSQIMEAADLRPETVTLLDETVIPAQEAKVGDLLLIRPGERIPLDCVVVTGQSRIDTAPITGEPVPVAVSPGSPVISGCVNTTGVLTLRVEKPLQESMVTRILHAVETAAAGKPRMDRFITRFARVYTPVVVAVALLTALLGGVITGQWEYWIYTALSFLVMSCPCALVLSVPLAFFSGIGAASRRGILFKGGMTIEALAGVKVAAMDKTGTLTHGQFCVQKCVGPDGLLELCAACESRSTHPIAQSITAYARQQGLTLSQPDSLEEIPGHGICARIAGETVLCGNEKLLRRFGVTPQMPPEVGTVVLVARQGVQIGYILVADALKPGAAQAMRQLTVMGLETVMLTGDENENARAVAAQAGIRQVMARLLPEQKLEQLVQLRNDHGPVLFVGDGINDAPVLAGADVGGAMGSGTDAALEAADVVYMNSAVESIPESIRIARATQRIAWQNVIFALAVKVVVMFLGLMGHASMWLAVFADSGVAMLCVLNAIRMLYVKAK